MQHKRETRNSGFQRRGKNEKFVEKELTCRRFKKRRSEISLQKKSLHKISNEIKYNSRERRKKQQQAFSISITFPTKRKFCRKKETEFTSKQECVEPMKEVKKEVNAKKAERSIHPHIRS